MRRKISIVSMTTWITTQSIQIHFCGEKDFLGRKIFSQISPVHVKLLVAAMCRATCHPTCRQGVICRRFVLQRHVAKDKFPFRKRSLSFLRQTIFDLLLRVILLKRKKIVTSNPDLSHPYVSPLPLHYHTYPPNVQKIKVHKLANCIHQLQVTLSLSITLNVKST